MGKVDSGVISPYSVFLLGEATAKVGLLTSKVQNLCADLDLSQGGVDMLSQVLLHARTFEEREV